MTWSCFQLVMKMILFSWWRVSWRRWSVCLGQPLWTLRQRSGEKIRSSMLHTFWFGFLQCFWQRGSPKWSDDETGPEENWPIPHDCALSWWCGQLWLWHLPDHHWHGGQCMWPLSWGTALWMSSTAGELNTVCKHLKTTKNQVYSCPSQLWLGLGH